jgi:signal transduction histidine kinase
MSARRSGPGLSRRLTRQATWAVIALVLGFGFITWFVTGAHVVEASREEAIELAEHVAASRAPHPLGHYVRVDDPHVWIFGPHRERVSPNTRGLSPPHPALVDFGVSPPMVVIALHRDGDRVVVGWPLASDLPLLRDLLVVILFMGGVSAIVAVWLTSWATRRMLVPVEDMGRLVSAMVAAREVSALPPPSAVDDEFTRLTDVFNQLLARLTEQSDHERQMLAQAAHELRTPLQVLRGNLDLLQDWDDLDDAVRTESLAQSRQVLDRLSRLVQDLLTLERARTGTERVEAVALVPLLETLVEDLRALAPDRRIHVRLRQATVMASPWRVERALWVVADNALKYTTPGTPLAVAVVTDPFHGQAGVELSDQGPGIPEDELPHIFDRFFRGKNASPNEGTGLGLPIARALVEHDGGTVTLRSQVRTGTTVRLLWPSADLAVAGYEPARSSTRAVPSTDPHPVTGSQPGPAE